jgi:hypothetical protein
MSIFSRKTVLIPKQSITVGEFDIKVDGAYRNVKDYPLETKVGKNVYVSVKSDNGVDVAIIDAKGFNEKFTQAVKDAVIGPVHVLERGKMALILGVYRGDLSHVEFEVWME